MSNTLQIKEIKELAKEFSPYEIDLCISQQLENGTNSCKLEETTEEVLNKLSKASFVRKKMDAGVPMMDAVRELAGRIRRLQKGFVNSVT